MPNAKQVAQLSRPPKTLAAYLPEASGGYTRYSARKQILRTWRVAPGAKPVHQLNWHHSKIAGRLTAILPSAGLRPR